MARWSARNPWKAIVGWLVFVALCLTAGAVIGERRATGADFRIGEAGHAQQIMDDGRLAEPIVENVLISARSGTLDVSAPIQATDRNALLVPVLTTSDAVNAQENVNTLLQTTAAVAADHPELRIEQSGEASINYQIDTASGEQTALAEKLSLPITLVILLVTFGALWAAGVPLIVAVSSVAGAMGLSIASSHVFPSVGQNNTMIVLIGMAVGVDYSLFYLRRAREERARTGGTISHSQAVELAAATSGHAVVVSGFAVIISVAAMFVAQDMIFTSLGVSVILVVAMAMLASLTVLPALLAKLGRFMDRPRLPWLGNHERESRVWPALVSPAVRRPGRTLLIGALVLAALAAPALAMRLNLPSYDRMPRVAGIITHEELVERFPMQGVAAFVVAVHSDTASRQQIDAALDRLERAAVADPAVAGKTTPVRKFSPDNRYATVRFGTPYKIDAPEAHAFLPRLRDSMMPSELGALPGVDYAVGGDVSIHDSDVRHLNSKLVLVVIFLLILTFAVMAVAFRSVVVGLVSTVLNMASAAAALGVLAFVFQSDWAARWLDLPPGGFIIARVPLFLFVILVGLSMDYQVFVVSRIREAALAGMATKEAVRYGIVKSAGVVTSAALVMISVFTGFVFGGLLEIKQVGLGLAFGIFVDAFIIRVVILPSLMTLLGQANWWPSRIPARTRCGV
jgi:RND superfamily putative drug exporter